MKYILAAALAVGLVAAPPALAQQGLPAGAKFATAVPTAVPAEKPRYGVIRVGNTLMPLISTKRAPKPKPQGQPVAKPPAPKVEAVAPAAVKVASAGPADMLVAAAPATLPVEKPQPKWTVSGINSLQYQPSDEELFQVLAYADRNGGLKDPQLEKDGVRQGYLEDQANPHAPLSERRRQVMIYYVVGTDGTTGMVMRAGENFSYNKTVKR